MTDHSPAPPRRAASAVLRPVEDVALARLLGLRLGQDGDTIVAEIPVREEALNSAGNLHGGAIATLVDFAAGTAAARHSGFSPGVNMIVTADLHVRYLGRARTGTVRAEARVLRSGRQLVVVECHVFDGERLIAAADFSSMIVPLRQPIGQQGDVTTPDL